MGQQELEAALRCDGENKAREIWQEVEAKATQLRRENAQTLDLQRQSVAARRQVEISVQREALLSAARKQAQNRRLLAEAALALRLKRLAVGLLEEQASIGGEKLFQFLATELPDYPWQRIRVNHRDEALAQATFPTAEVLSGEGISAGLEVQSDDGRIQIINTLEKRLEHLWQELLPELLKEFRQRAGDNETVT